MDTFDFSKHKIGTGESRDLYFALKGTGANRELIGWDVVDDHHVSQYQKMLDNALVDVFVINLKYTGQPIYFWDMQGWTKADRAWLEFLPKEVRMALLTGAL